MKGVLGPWPKRSCRSLVNPWPLRQWSQATPSKSKWQCTSRAPLRLVWSLHTSHSLIWPVPLGPRAVASENPERPHSENIHWGPTKVGLRPVPWRSRGQNWKKVTRQLLQDPRTPGQRPQGPKVRPPNDNEKLPASSEWDLGMLKTYVIKWQVAQIKTWLLSDNSLTTDSWLPTMTSLAGIVFTLTIHGK